MVATSEVGSSKIEYKGSYHGVEGGHLFVVCIDMNAFFNKTQLVHVLNKSPQMISIHVIYIYICEFDQLSGLYCATGDTSFEL